MTAHRSTALGALLVALRNRRRVSQGTLARQSGVSRAIISILERGHDPSTKKVPHPRPDTLRQIANGLAQDGDGRAEPGLGRAYYAELMQAAGYGTIDPAAAPPPAVDSREPRAGRIDEPDGSAEPDDFHSQLARHYGSENAAFVNEVVRCISDFPPKEAAFVRNLLIGAIHGARNPWSNSPSDPPKMAMLAQSSARS
jgi:transcriptional regulator with XRE-family HTH domain